jgi:serine/threonine-protein kinase
MRGEGVEAVTRQRGAQDTVFRPGDRFLRFLIVRLIGKGGIAEVYEILFNGRRHALKVLQRRFLLDPVQLRRAEQEAKFLVQVRNPNLVDVQETGVDEGIFWMRMELIEGTDLREGIHRLGPMSINLVYAWLSQAAYGAHQCHLFGIIHRDIKPENIMLTPPDTAKLLDLGLALVTVAGMGTLDQGVEGAPKGTAPYMSPEQARGDNLLTPASDVYALLMVGYEMLMGEHPFLRGGMTYDYWSMIHKQVHEQVPPLADFGFPDDLSRFFERGLSKSWQDRPQNGLALVDELRPIWRRYAEAHPDEDPNPGEPAITWLLDGGDVPPSFGTGPTSARRSGPRPSKPVMTGPRASNPPPISSGPRPVQRFLTEVLPRDQRDPSSVRALGPRITATPPIFDTKPDSSPLPASPPRDVSAPIEAEDRDTDPSSVPLPIRRFETVSLPPELRDPEAIRALAPYRSARPAAPLVKPERSVPAPRTALVVVAPQPPTPPPPRPRPESTFSTTVRSPIKHRQAPPTPSPLAQPALALHARLRNTALVVLAVTFSASLLALTIARPHRPVAGEPMPPPSQTGPIAAAPVASSPSSPTAGPSAPVPTATSTATARSSALPAAPVPRLNPGATSRPSATSRSPTKRPAPADIF